MNKQFLIIIALFLAVFATNNANSQTVFNNFDALISYATPKSINLQSGEIRLNQAKKAKIAAIMGIPDLATNSFLSYTNNTQLPVNLFPAEILGGQKGTFQEIQLGVQYNTQLNVTAEVKLLNLQGWENLKLSKMNIEANHADNKLTIKSFQEDIATIYFNIITLQEQLKATGQNLLAADTLQQIVENKFQQGLVKSQEQNSSKANYLNTAESVKQIKFLIAQQYLALKTLCDIPENEEIRIDESIDISKIVPIPIIDFNQLSIENSLWKEKRAWSSYRQVRLAQMPSISLFFSGSRQQFNPQSTLFDNNIRWIPSSYIGLRLSWGLPSANAISQTFKAKYDYQLALKNTEQVKIRTELNHKQLGVNYEKALSQWTTNQELYRLNQDSYQKNLNLYNDGLMGLDQTLNSFNVMVNSNYSLIASAISVLLAQSKIQINNKIR